MKTLSLKHIIVVALTGLAILWGALVLRHPHQNYQPPLPISNGYGDLVKAGEALRSEPAALDNLDSEELRSLVAQNAEALRLARAGLKKECRVPLAYSMSYMGNHISDLAVFKRLARGFVAEGMLAELEHRPKSAAVADLDAIRLGHECSRGGIIIDMLVGVACQSIGCRALQKLSNELQASDCREAIRQLEDIDAKAESATEVIDHERSWSRRAFGLRGQLLRLLTIQRLKQAEQTAAAKLQAQQKSERLLLIGLAARVYELDKGQRPRSVSDLVPNYLKAPPRPQ